MFSDGLNRLKTYLRHRPTAIIHTLFLIPFPMKLNPQQQAAIKYLGGPLLVLAGAGSGKTGVITQKIKHLIVNVGYLPHTVAAITFTNKAATEMQERVAKMLPKSQTRGLTICTFHSLGMKILREEANHIG